MSALQETLVMMYQARRAQEQVEAVRAAFGTALGRALEHRQRLVADLYYRGLSLGEIGETLGVPKSSAQRYVDDARIVYPWRPTPTLEVAADGLYEITVWVDGSPRSGPSGSG